MIQKICTASYDVFSRAAAITVLSITMATTGCTTLSTPVTPGTPTQPSQSLTGNWQVQLATTSGPLPFSSLAGFISESKTAYFNNGLETTATLQLSQPSACYAGTILVPLVGQYVEPDLGLYSFTVNGQYLDITSTVDSTENNFTGTYLITGGCAGSLNSQGTLAGTRYAPLNDTYTGTIANSAPAESISLSLAQSATGNGDGTSSITGTATFSGFNCFAQAPLTSTSGSALGSAVTLVFTDPTTSANVTMIGNSDPAGDSITFNSISVSAGACQGSLGTATVTS